MKTFSKPASYSKLAKLAKELRAYPDGTSVRVWVTRRGRVFADVTNVTPRGVLGGVPATAGSDHEVDELWAILVDLWALAQQNTLSTQ